MDGAILIILIVLTGDITIPGTILITDGAMDILAMDTAHTGQVIMTATMMAIMVADTILTPTLTPRLMEIIMAREVAVQAQVTERKVRAALPAMIAPVAVEIRPSQSVALLPAVKVRQALL